MVISIYGIVISYPNCEYKSLRSVLIPKSGNKSYCKNALQEPN